MKKVLVLTIIIALMLFGCGGDGSSADSGMSGESLQSSSGLDGDGIDLEDSSSDDAHGFVDDDEYMDSNSDDAHGFVDDDEYMDSNSDDAHGFVDDDEYMDSNSDDAHGFVDDDEYMDDNGDAMIFIGYNSADEAEGIAGFAIDFDETKVVAGYKALEFEAYTATALRFTYYRFGDDEVGSPVILIKSIVSSIASNLPTEGVTSEAYEIAGQPVEIFYTNGALSYILFEDGYYYYLLDFTRDNSFDIEEGKSFVLALV